MGSEVIIEVYEVPSGQLYVRILSNGNTLFSTARPLTGKEGPAGISWVGSRQEQNNAAGKSSEIPADTVTIFLRSALC
jgi:hypothetical protein